MIKMPVGWDHIRLSDIADINPKLDKNGFDDNLQVSFVPMPAVEAETGEIDVSATRRFGDVKKGYTAFSEGDVLFAKITPCMENGKVAIAPKLESDLGFGSTEFHVIRCNERVSSKYIYYFMSSKMFRSLAEHNMTGAVGQRRVPSRFIENYRVSLPFLYEQREIVNRIESFFSELDAGIASLKKAREQLDVYRQSLLKHAFEGKLTAEWRQNNPDKLEDPDTLLARIQTEREAYYQQQLADWQQAVKDWEAAGREGKKPSKPAKYSAASEITDKERKALPDMPQEWPLVRLSEIADVKSGMSVSKNRKLDNPVTVPYLRVANVQRGFINLSEVKQMPVEQRDLPRLQLSIFDILFNEGGDRDKLGRGWLWGCQLDPCITQNHVFFASPFIKNAHHSKFLTLPDCRCLVSDAHECG